MLLSSFMLSVGSNVDMAFAIFTNHSIGVTPLKFLHADPTMRLRRRPAAHKRRLNLAGLEMEGNLNTLGYFSAEVCVGSPPRSFDLIIDTGSALTAFPCSDCPHCGNHQHSNAPGSRFDVTHSTSSQRVECAKPPPGMHCRSCDNSMCSYGVSYTEGSSIRGRLVSDLFWFGSDVGPKTVRATFGCQTYESGLFHSQQADGIAGFSRAGSGGQGGSLLRDLCAATGAPAVG